MAYRLPTFNLQVNIWRFSTPLANPPDVTSPCQLRYPGSRPAGDTDTDEPQQRAYVMTLLLPPLVDIQDGFSPLPEGDVVEVPAFSGRYYRVEIVDDVAKGFPNEHRYAAISKADDLPPWPVPYP
jgi:hypothetical protein